MSDKLKPCPFCGEEAFVHMLGNEIAKGYYIACDECGAKTRVFGYEAEAIEAWNRRVATELEGVTGVIRCENCKWWNRLEDGHPYGYCRACRSGTHTERWEISIYRQNRYDFYCADAEPKENEDDDE